MHYFYTVYPAVSGVKMDPYVRSVASSGTMSHQQRLYYSGAIYLPTNRNLGGYCFNKDRTRIYLIRRLTWHDPYIETIAEGWPATHLSWWNAATVLLKQSDETGNPNGFLYLDPADESTVQFVVRLGLPQYVEKISAATTIKAGPTEVMNYYLTIDLQGNLFTVRGRRYLAYFQGNMYTTTKFLWMKDNKLPYSWG